MAHPDNAERLLRDDGQLVLVFPEGAKGPAKMYRDRYQLRRFGRGGFVEIAMRAGVPIVPIAVVGAEEAMPTLATFPTVARRRRAALPAPDRQHAGLRAAGAVAWFPAKFRLRVLPPVTSTRRRARPGTRGAG